jgi:hypothetical protein
MNRETLEKADVLSKHEVCSSEEWLIARSEVRKRPGYHLIALVGVPLIVAVCLLMQLDKLPQSSLNYSLLNGMVSVLFNFTSAALLKVSPFLISLLGLPKWFASSAR